MASTFSPSLRLELIGDGDQSGIWGQTTNNNLGALVEQAIAGVITINIIDANYTLTNFNGVSDEARNAVITITGTLSQQRNIIAPLADKVFTFRNATTGGFSIQIIGSSGTGVIIPNGATTSVYCDGTNFLPLNTGAAGNFSVSGNLSVTGTTTLTGALSGSTANFSGAVNSTNSVLSGTPAATTATAGDSTTRIATTAFVAGAVGALGTMSTQNANSVAITGGSITGITDLTVADGGTGASSITANSVVLGNGASPLSGNLVAPGASGNLLRSNGTTWVSGAPAAAFSVVFDGGIPYNSTTPISIDPAKTTLFFVNEGNGAGGNQFLFLGVEWGTSSLTNNYQFFSAGVNFQVTFAGALLQSVAAGSSTLLIQPYGNNITGYGAPSTAKCVVMQF
jgi:hypothetical protein